MVVKNGNSALCHRSCIDLPALFGHGKAEFCCVSYCSEVQAETAGTPYTSVEVGKWSEPCIRIAELPLRQPRFFPSSNQSAPEH